MGLGAMKVPCSPTVRGRIAIGESSPTVASGPTFIWREVPRMAEPIMSPMASYRPVSGGMPAVWAYANAWATRSIHMTSAAMRSGRNPPVDGPRWWQERIGRADSIGAIVAAGHADHARSRGHQPDPGVTLDAHLSLPHVPLAAGPHRLGLRHMRCLGRLRPGGGAVLQLEAAGNIARSSATSDMRSALTTGTSWSTGAATSSRSGRCSATNARPTRKPWTDTAGRALQLAGSSTE